MKISRSCGAVLARMQSLLLRRLRAATITLLGSLLLLGAAPSSAAVVLY